MLNEELLRKAQEGNAKAIEEVCSATWEKVYRFIYYKVQNREEAEDITQETYVKALASLERYRLSMDDFISFLKTISMNVLRDRWRKSKRRGSFVDIDEIDSADLATEDPSEESTERLLISSALEQLEKDQRQVIELRILKSYSAVEAGRIMNRKAGAIRVLQHRALQNLSRILEKMNIKENQGN